MNSVDHPESAQSEAPPAESIDETGEPDDEFENEELGERQAEACSMEEGCVSCE